MGTACLYVLSHHPNQRESSVTAFLIGYACVVEKGKGGGGGLGSDHDNDNPMVTPLDFV